MNDNYLIGQAKIVFSFPSAINFNYKSSTKTEFDCITISFLWYGTKHELRVTSYEFPVEGLKAGVELQNCEFKSTSYELTSTSYEFNFNDSRVRSSNPRVMSSHPRVQESFNQWKFK